MRMVRAVDGADSIAPTGGRRRRRRPRESLAAGWAWTAGILAAVAVARAAWPEDCSLPPDLPACAAPVELVPSRGRPRLGCAVQQPSPCAATPAAGDRLHAALDQDCMGLVRGGMRARWRLLTDLGIDLNRASGADLQAVAGIGPALARRIVADRQARGPFATVAELRRVQGIGPVVLARLAPQLTAEAPPAAGGKGTSGK